LQIALSHAGGCHVNIKIAPIGLPFLAFFTGTFPAHTGAMQDITLFKDRTLGPFHDRLSFSQILQSLSGSTLTVTEVPLWKRRLDVALVLMTAIFWGPVCLLIALYIKVVSPGPVLFKQTRVGHMGKQFCCLKFRTMKTGADTTVHQNHLNQLISSNKPMQKLDVKGDSRLIPGGRWLRAVGADELPQLINVLSGEMSLVGPRPCVPYEYELFQPAHRQRCHTLPGLTGLWQVNGKNRTTFERMMELDLAYVKNKSLLLDLQIIFSTLPALISQVVDILRAMAARKFNSVLAYRTRAGQ
jgi:lipopolysaccharide/colanic/teichoic acid biosynthesis glycosyltransferase